MGRVLKWGGAILAVAFVLVQFVPVDRSNPPVEGEVPASPEVREVLNFSTWNRISTQEQVEAMHDSWEEVAEGEMPLWFYLPPHPQARLTDRDRALLRSWSEGS